MVRTRPGLATTKFAPVRGDLAPVVELVPVLVEEYVRVGELMCVLVESQYRHQERGLGDRSDLTI